VPFRLVNLDIDGSITQQKKLSLQLDVSYDFRDLETDLRLWGLKPAIAKAKDRLNQARFGTIEGKATGARQAPSGGESRGGLRDPWLTFYGTGDFNHVSALLIETLPESARPLNLVLFDNHPDWFLLPPRYHCGNWVGTLLQNEWIESVTLIGQDSDDLDGHNFFTAPIKEFASGRVSIYPYRRQTTRIPLLKVKGSVSPSAVSSLSGTTLTFETVENLGTDRMIAMLLERLSGKNTYIAIDKDVLTQQSASTDWDQGHLELANLLKMLRQLVANTKVVGIDVCGDRAPNPLVGFLKNLDAGRLGAHHNASRSENETANDDTQATATNESTNLSILLECVFSQQLAAASNPPSE
jgi:hypothetical protein